MNDNHSVASSRSNMSGSTKAKLASSFFSTRFPLFPFLTGLQSDYSSLLVNCGVLITFVQILSFALNPQMKHGETLSELSYVTYAFQMPFWDPAFVSSVTYVQYVGIFYLAVAYVLINATVMTWWILSGSPVQAQSKIFVLWRAVVHSTSTWLYIPLLQCFLSNMVCTSSSPSKMWTLNESCYTTATTPNLALGIASTVLLIVISILITTSVFTTEIDSRHPLARATTEIDFLSIVWKTLLCVLFHVFVASGRQSWLAMTVFFSALIMAVLYAFLVPYFSQASNRKAVSMCLAASISGLLTFLANQKDIDPVFRESDMECIAFFASMLPCWWIGKWIADFRVNPQLIKSLPFLVDSSAAPPSSNHLIYPRRLPVQDLAYTAHREICAEISEQNSDEATGPVFLVPFLETVWIPSDVEVACRFLTCYHQLCFSWPRPQMLLLCARIFTKGLTKFWDNATVIVSLANYAFHFAGKASLGMQQLEKVGRLETTLNVRYVAFKLIAEFKAELNLRDQNYQKVCDVAKKLHKETLVHMHQFWSKLVAGQADVAQLAMLATIITQRRQQGRDEFLRALAFQNNDRALLTKYAGFLEQVMMEPEQAEQLRVYTKQEAEERKRTGIRGRVGRETQKANIDELINVQSKDSKSATGSSRTTVIVLFCLLFALIAVFIAVTVFHSDLRIRNLDNAFKAGKSRTLAAEGSLLSLRYIRNTTGQTQLPTAINDIANDLLSYHNSITWGTEMPSDPEHQRFLKEPLMMLFRYFTKDDRVAYTTNFWGLGYDVVQTLKTTLYADSKTEQEKIALASNLEYSFPAHVALSFNRSCEMASASYERTTNQGLLVTVVVYALCILVLGLTGSMLAKGSLQVFALKVSILSLFPIIPRTVLLRMCQQARERVDTYDAQEDDDVGQAEEMKQTLGEQEQDMNESTKETESKAGEGAPAEEGEALDDDDDDFSSKLLKKDTDSKKKKVNVDSNDDAMNAKHANISSVEGFSMAFIALLITAAMSISIYFLVDLTALHKNMENSHSLHELSYAHQDSIIGQREKVRQTLHFLDDQTHNMAINDYIDANFEQSMSLMKNPAQEVMDSFKNMMSSAREYQEDLFENLAEYQMSPSLSLSEIHPKLNAAGESMIGKLFDPRSSIQSTWYRYLHYLNDITAHSKERLTSIIGKARVTGLGGSLIAVAGLAGLGLAGFFPYFASRPSIFLSSLNKKLLIVAILLLGGTCVCTIVLLVNEKKHQDALLSSEDNLFQKNATVVTFSKRSDAARSFCETGSLVAYNAYFDHIDRYGLYFPLDTITSEEDPNYHKWREDLSFDIDQLSMLEKIGMRLCVSAYGVSATDSKEVQQAEWNFETDPLATQVRVEYHDEELRFTNTTHDLARTTEMQKAVARYTVFSDRYNSAYKSALNSIHDYYGLQGTKNKDDIKKYRDSVQLMQVLGMAFSCACGFIMVLYVMNCVNLVVVVGSIRTSNKSTTSDGQNAIAVNVVFIVAFILFSAVLGVELSSFVQYKNGADTVDAATAREWYIANSMLVAEQTANENHMTMKITHRNLEEYASRLADSMRQVYFGEDGKISYNIAGQNPAHDALMFKPASQLAADFQCGYTPNGSQISSQLFVKGVSAAMTQWISYLQTFSSSHNSTELEAVIVDMQQAVMPLLRASEQSSFMVVEHIKDNILQTRNISIILCCVTLIFLLGSGMWVIYPHIKTQIQDERGSRLLLHLIPQEVCTTVPAIAEFLENMKLIEAKSDADTSAEIHIVPIIAIDLRGVVLKFNTAAESLFGYTAAEVVGNKVNLLMPQKIAVQHDRFLSNYRNTGIRKVIGYNRQVHARHKSGEYFPMELSVKEFKRENGDVIYLGFIKDIARNLELQAAQELNNVIQELATVPMIAIDSLGTILRFNHAAEECFSHNFSDVVDQNVKILMPEAIAARHDAYLAAYLRTGQKTVIDSVRAVTGVKKSGEEFPLEISVKEIKSELGAMSTYLGFVRDLTSDLILQEVNRINEDICNLSPVPIIGIDPYGKVLKFNTAAAETFGYNQEEVVDNNIKMLMPQEISDAHDGYLEKYRLTKKKTIIGTEREVTARKKDGTLFPVMAMVREVKKEGSNQGTFVGYVVDLQNEKKNEYRKSIDDAIVNLMAVPVCIINETGQILRANKALLLEFGYRLDELLEHNVKVLTPNEIAVQHDQFLDNYKRTRSAKVIGHLRRVQARRKNGSLFPIEIFVNEVQDADGVSTYIGFMRNLVSELALEQSFLMNNICLDISSTPMIAIDHVGTIISFSTAAEKTWKMTKSKAIGKNVKILMPEHIAASHDQYLKTYRKTGIPKIIDNVTHQEAVDSEGKVFPVELCVREVKKEGHESKFVANVRDTSFDDETQKIVERNEQISNLSPLPLIQIDLYGSVLHYNSAAEADFQYTREEVVGRNIKMLLPDEIAKNHDNYLANYRKTRVKNIIGSNRRTRGKRKDGRTFAVEISVAEIEVDGDPDKNSYVAYIRNIQEELYLIKANEVSGAIADLSPSPLIAIDERGTIIKFNKAACDAFRYAEPTDVMGRNIKMLMPQSVSVKHDGYLKAYKKTKQKHVVDSTRVVNALRSDGTEFPVELLVREITKLGRESTYLSYLRDLTQERQMQTVTQLSDNIQTYASNAIIMIDKVGKILRVNPATVALFKYDSENDFLGKNVKMLTPPEISVQHDQFLANYARTGKKNVIGTQRQVSAYLKTKERVEVEISVQEVIQNGVPLYVGYLRDMTQELTLLTSRASNNIIVDNTPIPLLAINPRGTIQLASPAATRFFGFKEPLVGKNVKILMPESTAKHHDGYLENYLKTGKKTIIDSTRKVTAKLANGDHVPVKISVMEVESKTGEEKNYIGFLEDLTQTFAVDMSVATGKAMLDMIPLALISIDKMGTIREFGKAAEACFGYTKEEVVGKNLKMLMPEEIAVNHDGYLANYLKTGVRNVIGTTRRLRAVLKNRSEIHIEISVAEFKLDGEPYYCGFVKDLSQSLQMEEASQINSALVDLAFVPIIAIDHVGKVQRFNPAACKCFGYEESEILGQNIKMLMPEQVAANHDAYLDRYRKTQKEHILGKKNELKAKRKDGTEFDAELVVKEIKKAGKESTFVGYCKDITNELQFRTHAILSEAIESLMQQPLIVINLKGVVQTFTRAACDLFEYEAVEVIGCNIKMLMPQEVAVEHDSFLSNYLKTGKKSVIDSLRKVTAKTKSKKLIEVELKITEFVESDTQRYYIAYVRDCRGDFEKMLNVEVGAALIEHNPDAIIMIDTKGTILKFNQMAEQLFCFTRNQVLRRNIKILMPDSTAIKHDSYLSNYLRSGIKRVVDSERLVTAEKKNGEIFKANISVREVLDTEGRPQYYVGYIKAVDDK